LKNSKANNDPVSFASLLEKGETIAFEALFKLYYDKLTHVAKGFLVRHEDAEGVVQNVFLKLWENRVRLKNTVNMNSYLYTMTKNACLDQLKHEKVKINYLNSHYHKKLAIQRQFLKDEAASLLLKNELEQVIIKSLELLPEKCKKVFTKSRVEGLKHYEIAQELGISKKTVDNHISYALKHMRFHLKNFTTLFL
jgi:RNA polymerase sigma-70 factor (ECF subfamily)